MSWYYYAVVTEIDGGTFLSWGCGRPHDALLSERLTEKQTSIGIAGELWLPTYFALPRQW